MRGRFVRGLQLAASGERRLIAAVIGQALRDAKRGNREAQSWLDDVAPLWCRQFLGIDEGAAAAWRAADLGARQPPDIERERALARERDRRRRERNRATKATN